MQKHIGLKLFALFSLSLLLTTSAHASEPLRLTAKGVAVYGWKDGVPTPLYVKNEHWLYPIASLTKLITAKAVLALYPQETVFKISKQAEATSGTVAGIKEGAVFSRDDLLAALLVRSSNDAATAFTEPVGNKTFIQKMNEVLHTNKYTSRTFSNPSGLDPARKLKIPPNRMTPYHMSRLLSDIYTKEPLLRKYLVQPSIEIKDLNSNALVKIPNTNPLLRQGEYQDRILLSKTGLTNAAKNTMAFVTDGGEEYDYITVVTLGATQRTPDAVAIINWLDTIDTSR